MAVIDIKTGFSCNNDCVHCVAADRRELGDLTTQQVKAEVDRWREGPGDAVVVSGGEPTVRPDLAELVAHASLGGSCAVHLETNGSGLADAKTVRALREAGLTDALVAVHGHEAWLHDRIVRAARFDGLRTALANLLEVGINVRTNTVISRYNARHLRAIVEFLTREHRGVRVMVLTYPHPLGNAWTFRHEVLLSYRDLQPHLLDALEAATEADVRVGVDAVPLCFLSGHEHQDLRLQERLLGSRGSVKGSDFSVGEDGVADYVEALARDRTKAAACSQCSLDPLCQGVWRGYARVYGLPELQPVTDRDPVEVLSRFERERVLQELGSGG
jgi:MoaA/NifB/PqqE/SkfB family radical SAM enzyme